MFCPQFSSTLRHTEEIYHAKFVEPKSSKDRGLCFFFFFTSSLQPVNISSTLSLPIDTLLSRCLLLPAAVRPTCASHRTSTLPHPRLVFAVARQPSGQDTPPEPTPRTDMCSLQGIRQAQCSWRCGCRCSDSWGDAWVTGSLVTRVLTGSDTAEAPSH